jgi:copper transport protein
VSIAVAAGRGRPATRRAGIVGACIALALTLAPTAAAAVLIEPPAGATLSAPPASVRVVVSSPLEEGLVRARVRGPRGAESNRVAVRPGDPQAMVIPVPRDGEGTYGVAWWGLTTDGHPVAGSTTFAVGRSAPAADVPAAAGSDGHGAWAIVARVLVLIGVLGTAGMAVAREWVLGGAWRHGGIQPPGVRGVHDTRASADAVAGGPVAAWWFAWWLLLAAWAAGLAIALPAQAVAMGGEWAALFTGTRWGGAWMGLMLLAALAAVAALVTRAGDPSPAPGGIRMYALGVPGMLGAILLSWSGHAASGSDSSLGTALDVVHGWATALWLGGLVMLAVLALPLLARMDPIPRVRLGAGVVVRFSALAVVAVVVLVITGIYRALAELPSLASLWTTDYGVVLLVKIGVFIIMLGVAGGNRFILHPRLERVALGLEGGGSQRDAIAALRTSVRAELALALLVMIAVGLLVGIMPPS